MASHPGAFLRSLILKVEINENPLVSLTAIRKMRAYLDRREDDCIRRAHDLGASPTDIGHAIGLTRQTVYNRLRAMDERGGPGQPFVIPDLETEGTSAVLSPSSGDASASA